MSKRRTICLFGLSADPPTGSSGHVGIVKALLDYKKSESNNDESPLFDSVHVLPVYRHTFSSKRSRLETFEHRYKLCQLAFTRLSDRVVVSDAEYKSWLYATRDKPSEEHAAVSVGTASLLDYLMQSTDAADDAHSNKSKDSQRKNSSITYYFCLGADAFIDLTDRKWKESQRVLDLLQGRFIVLHRKQAGNDNLDFDSKLRERVASIDGCKLLELPQLDAVSSSIVRSSKDIDNLVVPAVLGYIKAHKLYAFAE